MLPTRNPHKIDLDKAYEILGLQPLDEWFAQRVEENQANGMELDPYRRIGATTWMLTCACIDFWHGTDITITIVTRPMANEINRLKKDFIFIYRRLYDDNPELQISENRVQYSTHPDFLCVAHFGTSRVGAEGQIYDEKEWKEKAIRRALGPWGEIQFILMLDSPGRPRRYLAQTRDRKPVLELTAKGFEQIKTHPFLGGHVKVLHKEVSNVSRNVPKFD